MLVEEKGLGVALVEGRPVKSFKVEEEQKREEKKGWWLAINRGACGQQ